MDLADASDWPLSPETAGRRASSRKARQHTLLGVSGLCTALCALVLSNVIDTSPTHAWTPSFGLVADDMALEMHVQVVDVDMQLLQANLNVTMSSTGITVSQRGEATLKVAISGTVHTLQWPAPTSFPVNAQLTEVVPHSLKPFDAYSLSLSPAYALITTCSPDSVDSENGAEGSFLQTISGDISSSSSSVGTSHNCISTRLPLRVAFGGSSSGTFSVTPRSTDVSGFVAAHELLIRRPTSQRVLRLMAHMLQWVAVTYVLARCAGVLMCRLFIGHCFRHIHSVL